jgi:LPXTG-site transpeptidase (sortase) family protein
MDYEPDIRLTGQIKKPSNFNPSKSWVDGDYLYRFDEGTRICQRAPMGLAASAGTAYFETQSEVTTTSTTREPKAVKKRARGYGKLINAGLSAVFISSFFVFVYPWLPELAWQIHPGVAAGAIQASAPAKISKNRLIIPKIGVDAKILEGPSLAILNKEEGVWHQTGGQNSNLVLAGHRFKYLPPNTTTFYNLNKLTNGDTVVLDWLGHRSVYTVTEVKTVPATAVQVIAPSSTAELTLYTCDDKKQTRRVVVTAKPLP